jgi:hypothetical protein
MNNEGIVAIFGERKWVFGRNPIFPYFKPRFRLFERSRFSGDGH